MCVMMMTRQRSYFYLDIYIYIGLVNHFRSSPFKQLVLIRLIVRVRLIFYMYLTTPLFVVTSDFRMCSMIIDNMYLEKKYVWIVSHDWIVVNDQWSIWVSSIHVFFLSLSLYVQQLEVNDGTQPSFFFFACGRWWWCWSASFI